MDALEIHHVTRVDFGFWLKTKFIFLVLVKMN